MRINITWLALVMVAGCAAQSADTHSDDIAGYWAGSASFRGAQLDIAVRLDRLGDSLAGVFSAPDITLLDQPLSSVSAPSSSDVHFTLDAPAGAPYR